MSQLTLKRMGVMNITPDSFSDGGELTLANFSSRLQGMDAVDLGAESTAPMNSALACETEWERLQPYLPLLKDFQGAISIDSYHPETIEEVLKFYQFEGLTQPLIWNDVSGKFDDFVWEFLSFSENFHYVFCHNLAPTRALTGRHMDYVSPEMDLGAYFAGKQHPQVIFDPCLGFSKTYEQNWWILENFHRLQPLHSRWLLGFSRKSFLRKKHGLTLEQREALDEVHLQELQRILPKMSGEVWIRTHRPDLVSY